MAKEDVKKEESLEDIINIDTELKDVTFAKSGELFDQDLLDYNVRESEKRWLLTVLVVSLLLFAVAIL